MIYAAVAVGLLVLLSLLRVPEAGKRSMLYLGASAFAHGMASLGLGILCAVAGVETLAGQSWGIFRRAFMAEWRVRRGEQAIQLREIGRG